MAQAWISHELFEDIFIALHFSFVRIKHCIAICLSSIVLDFLNPTLQLQNQLER